MLNARKGTLRIWPRRGKEKERLLVYGPSSDRGAMKVAVRGVLNGALGGLLIISIFIGIHDLVSSGHSSPPYPCPDHLTCVWGPVVE